MPTSGKKFLRPMYAVIATLLTSALQNSANAAPALVGSIETASKLSSAQAKQDSLVPQQLIVEPSSNLSQIRQAQHMSHSSHSSHSSHQSHYSGYHS